MRSIRSTAPILLSSGAMSSQSSHSAASASEAVLAYHVASKHRFEAYAPGPEALDWAAQPAPFRHFAGAPQIRLPAGPTSDALGRIGAVLRLAFGISAWKSFGPDRWAVRCNPSSGNLHPVEAYLLVRGHPALGDGLYHYRPEAHALELRAAHPPGDGQPLVALALSSVMWREAWKYGLRAFRYCQLDTGHAMACVAQAAALQGWSVHEQSALGEASLGSLLGLDRAEDFPAGRDEAELEEAEVLLTLGEDGAPVAMISAADCHALAAIATWYGRASPIDLRPLWRWPGIAEVARASRREDDALVPARHLPPMVPAPEGLILARRSAQRFEPRHVMSADGFAALMALASGAAVEEDLTLLIFLHRVEGLRPGVYALLPAAHDDLKARLAERIGLVSVPGPWSGAEFVQLGEVDPKELRRIARAVHCHQEIAASACLALGMLSRLAAPLRANAASYRDRLRAAGRLGQALYLQAEALGLSGTGIGCYFDDPVHALIGIEDSDYQSLYHFTIGQAIEDPRIETTAPYLQENAA